MFSGIWEEISQTRYEYNKESVCQFLDEVNKLYHERQLRLDVYFAAYEWAFEKWLSDLGMEEPKENAERQVLRYGLPSWKVLRKMVYIRDGGICWVCENLVPWEYYELGHIHDRAMGGDDAPDNLVVMCNVCNRLDKPLHSSKEDARIWKDGLVDSNLSFGGVGYSRQEVFQYAA